MFWLWLAESSQILVGVMLLLLSSSLCGTALHHLWRQRAVGHIDPKSRWKASLLAIGVLASSIFLWSAIYTPDTRDISRGGRFHGEDVWKSYKQNGIYRLHRDLFYGRAFYRNFPDSELFPPWGEPGEPQATRFVDRDFQTGETFEVVPESIKTFTDNPEAWRHIKGAIPKGTKLTVRRVLYKRGWMDAPDEIYYIADFVDGPFAGQSVLLNRISSTHPFEFVPTVNSSYLEPLDTASQP